MDKRNTKRQTDTNQKPKAGFEKLETGKLKTKTKKKLYLFLKINNVLRY